MQSLPSENAYPYSQNPGASTVGIDRARTRVEYKKIPKPEISSTGTEEPRGQLTPAIYLPHLFPCLETTNTAPACTIPSKQGCTYVLWEQIEVWPDAQAYNPAHPQTKAAAEPASGNPLGFESIYRPW